MDGIPERALVALMFAAGGVLYVGLFALLAQLAMALQRGWRAAKLTAERVALRPLDARQQRCGAER